MKKWNVGWGPISYCNMNCEFCYSKSVRGEDGDLGLEDWKKFIDGNHQYIRSINYGTGENSLSVDWFTLLEYVHDVAPDILQGVTSNGHISAMIKKHPELYDLTTKCISEIDISLDSYIPEKHNTFRGQPNAFTWVNDTLEMFKDTDISLTLVMLGTNDTLQPDNIEGILKLADKYNTKFRINMYRPTGGINEHSKRFIPSYEVILNTLKYMSENHTILSISDPLFNAILNKDLSKVENDSSGSESLRILHNGYITPSTYLITSDFREHNIGEEKVLSDLTFDKDMIWEGLKAPDECVNCKYKDSCKGGALDRRYLWYGTTNARDPYCPFREGNYEPSFKIDIPEEEFSSIHYGYLPTLFFTPKKA